MRLTKEIEDAILELEDAAFQAGEWDDRSGCLYEERSDEVKRARRELRKLILGASRTGIKDKIIERQKKQLDTIFNTMRGILAEHGLL